ncbi:asparaginase [Gymnodinialimonas hymeniacidonis]|uniref:asparaginase n=1 Tax=Gymnodinialimonas hymeniacidonis TaxID=3126508 RepID=UPI0034C5B46F
MAETADAPLVEVHRGPIRECVHRGHAVIWHNDAGMIGAWGNADAYVLPRSSAKMIQALPLIESGAADTVGLTPEQLALACASHNGAATHTDRVTRWLSDLGLSEADLRCGPQEPSDIPARNDLVCTHTAPDQRHNNCSGKHSGFLTLSKHLRAGPEYIDPDHPVQRAIAEATSAVTDEAVSDYAIDGCSAPNFAGSLSGFARAMARFAAATADGGARQAAMVRLREAMMTHPDLVAGEGRACTRLMRAMGNGAAVKTGAEGVFFAIIPEHKIGVALKISDGATRGSEAALAQILANIGVLDRAHPVFTELTHGPIRNRREVDTGHYKVVNDLAKWRP